MSHLGALITPFVDGELSPARAAEAQAHLADCGECRRLLAMEQAARRRTQESVRGVRASADLTARLLAMPTGPLPAAAPQRARRASFLLSGGAALVGLFVLTLVVLGAPRTDHPSAFLAAAEEAGATADADRFAPDTAVLAAWALPADHTVQSLGLLGDGDTETLDAVLETSAGEVRLLERIGSFDDAVLSQLPSRTVAGRTAYLVDGWYVLESGSCVVAVLGESDAAVEAVIAQLPAPAPDGIGGRILAGWYALVG